MLKGVFLRLLKICPVLWPAPSESLQASSDHLSHFLLHLGLPLLPRLSSNNARGYSRHWPFGFARIQCHLFFLFCVKRFFCLLVCPFVLSQASVTFQRAWFAGAWEAALTAGSGTAEGRAWANSRDFPEARLPLLGPPPYFEGWNWKEWVLYLVRCFLFNLER